MPSTGHRARGLDHGNCRGSLVLCATTCITSVLCRQRATMWPVHAPHANACHDGMAQEMAEEFLVCVTWVGHTPSRTQCQRHSNTSTLSSQHVHPPTPPALHVSDTQQGVPQSLSPIMSQHTTITHYSTNEPTASTCCQCRLPLAPTYAAVLDALVEPSCCSCAAVLGPTCDHTANSQSHVALRGSSCWLDP
jgi:hypothetical protein